MSKETFENIVSKYGEYLQCSTINKAVTERKRYPVMTFAGLGEPLLHSQISDFIREAKRRGFFTILFTNASKLDCELSQNLINAGIDQVYISFWGIEKDEYERTMGLDYSKALKNIEYFAKVFPDKTSLTITWIKSPKIHSTSSEIQEFWDKKGILVENEDTLPWNRAGYLTNEIFSQLFKEFPTISYEKKIWCSQLFFTDTIGWNGDVVLCSQDYFEKKYVLGNINNSSIRRIAEMKKDILKKKTKIDLCGCCKKPSHNYGFASAPWDKILSVEEKSKYWYQ